MTDRWYVMRMGDDGPQRVDGDGYYDNYENALRNATLLADTNRHHKYGVYGLEMIVYSDLAPEVFTETPSQHYDNTQPS